MSKFQSALVSNGAYDAVYVGDGSFLTVDPTTFKFFVEAEAEGDNFSLWHGDESWDDYAQNIDEAVEIAENEGQVLVAYYDTNNKLHINDEREYEERRRYYGLDPK